MDLALESTNQRGLYQVYLILIVIFLPFSTYIIAAGYPYLTNVPVINCQLKDKPDSPFEKWDMDEFVKISRNITLYLIIKVVLIIIL